LRELFTFIGGTLFSMSAMFFALALIPEHSGGMKMALIAVAVSGAVLGAIAYSASKIVELISRFRRFNLLRGNPEAKHDADPPRYGDAPPDR
jgi:hypothetical protein